MCLVRLSFLLYELELILMPYTYGSCEGYFGGIIKVPRALCMMQVSAQQSMCIVCPLPVSQLLV